MPEGSWIRYDEKGKVIQTVNTQEKLDSIFEADNRRNSKDTFETNIIIKLEALGENDIYDFVEEEAHFDGGKKHINLLS